MAFLQDIKTFSDTGKLNHVDTIVTTTDGKRVSVVCFVLILIN